MNSQLYIRLALRFALYVLLQILVLNHVELHGLMNPYIYPLLIILLPLGVPRWGGLIIAFVMGYIVGYFTNASGLHAAALLAITFIRPTLLRLFFPGLNEEEFGELNLTRTGTFNFVIYVVSMVLTHHFILFMLQVWSLQLFGWAFMKIIFSTIISSILILLAEYLMRNKKA